VIWVIGTKYCEQQGPSHELSFRELTILDTNHRIAVTVVEWLNHKRLEFVVTKHVFLNMCAVVTAICALVDDV
jgi:hypothetical protein